MVEQDVCPICTGAFKNSEVIISFRKWPEKEARLAHLDCALMLSEGEKRKHPGD
jgi:hypothetical protein